MSQIVSENRCDNCQSFNQLEMSILLLIISRLEENMALLAKEQEEQQEHQQQKLLIKQNYVCHIPKDISQHQEQQEKHQ